MESHMDSLNFTRSPSPEGLNQLTGFSEVFTTSRSRLPLLTIGMIYGIVFLGVTALVSRLKFNGVRNSKASSKNVPVVPYYLPFINNLISLLNPPRFIDDLIKQYGRRSPLMVHAGPLKFSVLTSAHHINMIFKNGKEMSSQPGILYALENLFATPRSVLSFYAADDSGLAARAKKGSKVVHEDRINYWQYSLSRKYLSGASLQRLIERYQSNLLEYLDELGINNGQWIEVEDLYGFVQTHVAHTAIKSLMGTEILAMNPTLIADFWEFDNNVRHFLLCLPRWILPGAYKSRDRLLQGIKDWHIHAHANFDCSRVEPEDPEWEPYFGSKLIRARENAYTKMSRMNEDSRASEALGFLFAMNANAMPSLFWMLFESLRNPKLGNDMLKEVQSCQKSDEDLDLKALITKPLLQSAYTEVLRLRVAISSFREHETDETDLGDYRIPKKTPIAIFSRVAAMDRDGWGVRPHTLTHPLEDFWAERFIEPLAEDEETKEPLFSMAGLNGSWLPYGGGNHMCPGRHFAKSEIIGTFSTLMSNYEIELKDPANAGLVKPDYRWSLLGALPPASKVGIRLRKKPTA